MLVLGSQPLLYQKDQATQRGPCGEKLRPLELAPPELPANIEHQLTSSVSESSWKQTLQAPVELPQVIPHGAESGLNCKYVNKINDCCCFKLQSFGGGGWYAAVDNQNKKGQGQQKMNPSQMVTKVNFIYLIASSLL